jgi:hypothetical protein
MEIVPCATPPLAGTVVIIIFKTTFRLKMSKQSIKLPTPCDVMDGDVILMTLPGLPFTGKEILDRVSDTLRIQLGEFSLRLLNSGIPYTQQIFDLGGGSPIIFIPVLRAESSALPEDTERHGFDSQISRVMPAAISLTDNSQTHTGTTSFIDNSTGVAGDARTSAGIKRSGPPQFDSNSIREFMAKPGQISTITLSTQVQGDVLSSFSISSTLLSNTVWMNKIQGYNLFRGTACFRMVVNAQPYQQGQIVMSILPFFNSSSASWSQVNYQHNSFIASKMQRPHVKLDLQDTAAEFRVPYVAPTSYYDINADADDWGTIDISVLAPLRYGTGGATSVTIDVFMWFEDVEMSAPYYKEAPTFLMQQSQPTLQKPRKLTQDGYPLP